jgi:hypothetical protein
MLELALDELRELFVLLLAELGYLRTSWPDSSRISSVRLFAGDCSA